MPEAHMRKKAPEAVRKSLLDMAANLAADLGITAVTTQAVAAGAGVTKGGLFHHFANKDALLDAMVTDILQRVDAVIDARMALDPDPYGAFTRAYVACALAPEHEALGRAWKALGVSMTAEHRLLRLWSDWLDARLRRHAATDGTRMHEIVRLAADGAWLMQGKSGQCPTQGVPDLRNALEQLTRPDAPLPWGPVCPEIAARG
ncbi:MAG: TetR/AcrR family transcriptional regulator [Roseinatronobacter sp.]